MPSPTTLSRTQGSSFSPPLIPPKRKRADDNVDALLISQIEKLSAECDEAGSFGGNVATRLRRLTPRQRALHLEINKVYMTLSLVNKLWVFSLS